jgi:Flp pilus assembly protein TadG
MMRRRFFRDKDGQIIVWFATSLGVLILFAALSIDMGMIYMTKARLSNAVDSAVLTAAKNASLGETSAKALGSDMFLANMGTACNSGGITCTWTYCPGDAGCLANTGITATLHATTPYYTNFMEYLPTFGSFTPALWTLGDIGQATRSTLVMTIVLDRSGSMASDGGQTALTAAVPLFVADFSEGTDYLGLVSFASHSSIDVPISTTFKTAIDNAVAGYNFEGGTFGTGAGSGSIYTTTNGPPLTMADAQNTSIMLGANVPEVKVVVYFTDGLMNTIQDQFNCTNISASPTLINYGGYDASQGVDWVESLNPFSETLTTDDWGTYSPSGNGAQNNGIYGAYNTYCKTNGNYVTKFPSQQSGGQVQISRANVTAEAQYRAIYTANQMRGESPIPTYIYTIGLGSEATVACTEAFLATVANDPNGSTYSCPSNPAVYNSSLPQGEFFPIPSCPGSQCTSELTYAFQVIAQKVLLRLSE